jgi:hypothetical protein
MANANVTVKVAQPREQFSFGNPGSGAGSSGVGGGGASKENVGGGLEGGVDRRAVTDPRRLIAVLQEMSSRKRERSRRVSKEQMHMCVFKNMSDTFLAHFKHFFSFYA